MSFLLYPKHWYSETRSSNFSPSFTLTIIESISSSVSFMVATFFFCSLATFRLAFLASISFCIASTPSIHTSSSSSAAISSGALPRLNKLCIFFFFSLAILPTSAFLYLYFVHFWLKSSPSISSVYNLTILFSNCALLNAVLKWDIALFVYPCFAYSATISSTFSPAIALSLTDFNCSSVTLFIATGFANLLLAALTLLASSAFSALTLLVSSAFAALIFLASSAFSAFILLVSSAFSAFTLLASSACFFSYICLYIADTPSMHTLSSLSDAISSGVFPCSNKFRIFSSLALAISRISWWLFL